MEWRYSDRYRCTAVEPIHIYADSRIYCNISAARSIFHINHNFIISGCSGIAPARGSIDLTRYRKHLRPGLDKSSSSDKFYYDMKLVRRAHYTGFIYLSAFAVLTP